MKNTSKLLFIFFVLVLLKVLSIENIAIRFTNLEAILIGSNEINLENQIVVFSIKLRLKL